MKYTISREQYNALEGLAFHVANKARYAEENGANGPENRIFHENIICSMDECDAAGIPHFVQNIAIIWAEQWRNTLREYAYNALNRRGIQVA